MSISAPELKVILSNKQYNLLKRHPQTQKKYDNYLAKNPDAAQKLYNELFCENKYPCVYYKATAAPEVKIVITENVYRYDLDRSLDHRLIWTDGAVQFDVIEKIAQSFAKNKTYYLWQNPTQNQSVKTINHFHLVVAK